MAQDWYLGLCGKQAAGMLVTEKTVQDAAEKFTREYEVITEGEQSEKWVQGHQIRLRVQAQREILTRPRPLHCSDAPNPAASAGPSPPAPHLTRRCRGFNENHGG